MSNTEQRPESYVRNCLIHVKEGDSVLFHEQDGVVSAHLDGYAIIPIERYTALGGALGEPIVIGGDNV